MAVRISGFGWLLEGEDSSSQVGEGSRPICMSYLLDTNIVSFYLRGIPNVVTRLKSEKPSNIAISAISAFELRYGVAKRKSPKLKSSVDGFLSLIFIVPFDDDAALRAGTLKSDQEDKGFVLDLPDLLIAAHALCLNRILVTNNSKHFAKVKNLRIEDWSSQ
jgi:tRNA(fMet)-specific endonuclease VapC